MAYIADFKRVNYSSLGGTTVGELPPTYESGDLLIAIFGMQNPANDFSTPAGGWASIGSAAGGANTVHAFWLSASSSSETAPSSNHTSEAYRYCTCLVIKDAPSVSPIDTSAFSATYNSSALNTHGSESATTTVNDVLLLHVCQEDQWRQIQVDAGPMLVEQAAVVDGQLGYSLCWDFKETAGAIPTFNWRMSSGTNDSVTMVIPIKSNAGIVPPRGDISAPCSTPLVLGRDGGYLGYTFSDPTSVVTAVDGISTQFAGTGTDLGVGVNTTYYVQRLNDNTIGMTLANLEMDTGGVSMSGKKVAFHPVMSQGQYTARIATLANHGMVVGLKSGTDEYAFWDAGGFDTKPHIQRAIVVDQNSPQLTLTTTGGAFVPTDIQGVCQGFNVEVANTTNANCDRADVLNDVTIIGGDAALPCSWETAYQVARSTNLLTIEKDGRAYTTKQDINVGNGTDPIYFSTNGGFLQSPVATDNYEFQAAGVALTTNIPASGTFKWLDPVEGAGSMDVTVDGSASAAWEFAGGSINNPKSITLNDIGAAAYDGFTVRNSSAEVLGDGDMTGVSFENFSSTTARTITGATQAALQAELDKLTRATFSGSTTYGLTISFTGTGDVALTAPSNIQVDKTLYTSTNASALSISTTTNESFGTLSTGGAATGFTEVAPTFDLDVTVNVSATIRVFTTGTQTELTSTTGTSLSWTHGNQTVDITIWAAGYAPQRETGIDLTNANVARVIELVDEPAYDAGHGLTYTTDLTYDRSLKELNLVTRNVGRAIYSALIDAWDAQTSLHNTAFPLRPNGSVSFIFRDGAVIQSGDEDNWYGAGYEYRNGAGVVQKQAASFVSTGGTWTGATAEYQTTAGTGQTDARATGAIDETIVIYTNGGSDLRNHWVWKYQVNGYEEARADMLDLFGIAALEPTEYVFNMPETAITAATGDPAVTLTFTDHGATPVTWNGKEFSITIQSNESGETILRELNYNHSLDATYNGEVPFNWWDMVVEAGSAYETQRGIHEGGTYKSGTTRKGVRVLNGAGDPHPDFTRFQADDGTYYTPPVVNSVSITNLPTTGNVRLWIKNNTTATVIYNGNPGAAAYSDTYTEGTDYTDGDEVEVRFAAENPGVSFQSFSTTFNVGASGWSLNATNLLETNATYALLGIDGSAVTGHTADHANDEVDLTAAANFDGTNTQAFLLHTLTTAVGIEDFWGGYTIRTGEILIHNAVLDMWLDNPTTTNIRETSNLKIHRDDGAYPVRNNGATTSGGGGITVRHLDPVITVNTGSVNQTTLLDVQATVNAVSSTVAAIEADTAEIGTAGAGLTAIPLSGVRAELGLAAANLDTQLATIDTNVDDIELALAGTQDANIVSVAGNTFAAANQRDAALGIVRGSAVTGTLSTTEMTTDLTEATDDHYIGRYIIWVTGALAEQAAAVTDYDGATRKLVFEAVTEAPTNGDEFVLV